ncbi:MAG TPA: Hsp20/alpha crystallin family protein, partial [Chitinophagaceae bacterium]|nr:Hsp20/alpha crystallin family protein [Chitinophagaceae bacterium]
NYSSFSRSFSLPENVKKENIEARYDNGILVLILPKKEEVKKAAAVKSIAVK